MQLHGIGPEVLLLCFLLVAAAAFALGRRTARGRRLRRDLDYFAGLDHLVNDRFDRAIAIHGELEKNREAPIREQATFALGLDYMSAGLLDRAEEKLRSLMGSAQYRAAVLERLAWVYEQQREWRAALDIWRELPAEKRRERAVVAAHYCCELGEAALAANDIAQARVQLAAARVHAPTAARVQMLAARVAVAAGEQDKALELYGEALGGS